MTGNYILWHGGFAPVRHIDSWIEGPGWVYRSDGIPERYWSEQRRVWKVQVLDCCCGRCDRAQYSRPSVTYPEWAGGLPVDNRLTHVTGTLYKSPSFNHKVEESHS